MKENSSFDKKYFIKAYGGFHLRTFNEMKMWYLSIIKFAIKHFNLELKYGYALDVGCGYGYVSALTHSLGFTSVGCDISRYAISIAKKLAPDVEFVCCDACHLPFRENSFTLCTQFEILEHLKSPLFALREGHRVLDQNGVLLATSHNPSNILYRIPLYTKLIYASANHDPTHINLQSPNGWRGLLKSLLFSTSVVRAISYVPFIHHFIHKLIMITTPDELGHTNLIVCIK
jgi:ubiquinone/menaquinone biosynthesis C-methylase UbiE